MMMDFIYFLSLRSTPLTFFAFDDCMLRLMQAARRVVGLAASAWFQFPAIFGNLGNFWGSPPPTRSTP
jgi:hypothetical protein